MIKRLDLILNGKGGVGKCYDCLLYFLNQPSKTAVGRLVLCKPFLARGCDYLRDHSHRDAPAKSSFAVGSRRRIGRRRTSQKWNWN